MLCWLPGAGWPSARARARGGGGGGRGRARRGDADAGRQGSREQHSSRILRSCSRSPLIPACADNAYRRHLFPLFLLLRVCVGGARRGRTRRRAGGGGKNSRKNVSACGSVGGKNGGRSKGIERKKVASRSALQVEVAPGTVAVRTVLEAPLGHVGRLRFVHPGRKRLDRE